MAADISFFGSSVQVGSFQDSTFITNATGTAQGPQNNNLKYVGTTSGLQFNGSTVAGMEFTQKVPNQSGSLNVRFTFDTQVMTQNSVMRIFDRVLNTNPASGVDCYAVELIHPWPTNTPIGSGGAWTHASQGSIVLQNALNLLASPGLSGTSVNGPGTSGIRHDWYCGLSSSPESIGSKTSFGLYVSLEYL
jgi:hypothetical protein